MWVMTVFSSDNSRPLAARKLRMSSLASSAISFVAAVTMKSSAYRTRLTLLAFFFCTSIFPRLFLWKRLARSSCIPSSVIFARIGDITPPCGVPSSVENNSSWKTNPALRNCLSTDWSMGICSTSQSWLIWSKHPLMSPSRIHFGAHFLLSAPKIYSQASCAQRPLRKPKDFGSAVVSDTGSSASA